MFTTLSAPGPCQRLGCGKDGNTKFRIDGELFGADPERGVEAGYRLYGLCCACPNEGTVVGLSVTKIGLKSK
jgi:hypothetical protein